MAIIADILTQVDAAATAVGATAFDAVASEIVPIFRVGSVLVVVLVGINLMKAKLSAFAVSSYIVGISGALFVFLWRGAAEPNLFDIPLSFRVLFIVIISPAIIKVMQNNVSFG